MKLCLPKVLLDVHQTTLEEFALWFLIKTTNVVSSDLQYGEAKLTPFMYIKEVNFASPYCTNKYIDRIA